MAINHKILSLIFRNFARVSIVLWIITFNSCVISQKVAEVKPSVNFDIKIQARIVKVDNLGKIYLTDHKNKLINYKPDFTELYRYANNRSGLISSVDVTNPLKNIVFYDDYNQVKILDNTLTLIHEINLGSIFSDISACANSNDGHIWIFDPTQFKLLKIDDNARVVVESSNVNDFGMTHVKITSIQEKSNVVVLMDKSKGFYFFDNLGQYLFHFTCSDIVDYEFDGINLVYYTSNGLNVYNIEKKQNLPISISNDVSSIAIHNIIYHQSKYYVVYENGIKVLQKLDD